LIRPRVAIVGAGNVGATVAQGILGKEVADVVLLDVVEGLPQGKALDLAEAGPVEARSSAIAGSTDFSLLQGSDAVVITAGLTRKPGMSRDDLLATNAGIVGEISARVAKEAPEALVVVVTNPLDVMTYLAWKATGFRRERVLGMAGVLDSTRFAYFVSEELGVSPKDVYAMVLGGHGDSMVPLPRYTTVSGVPITDLLPAEKIASLVKRTREGGAEIVGLLKQGSAYYAPGGATVLMVQSLLKDEKRLLPVAAILDGEFREKDVCIGVPAIIGRSGVERIIELKLSQEEGVALKESAAAVRRGLAHLRDRKLI
jgi:malate dehydrogenase